MTPDPRSEARALLTEKLRYKSETSDRFVAALREGHEEIAAIVFYGSLLSDVTKKAGSYHDFYVLIDGPGYYRRLRDRVAGRFLAPSIYFHLFPDGLRCKTCVLTLDQLEREVSPRAHDIHNVGRFSKRVAVVYARDNAIYDRIVDSCLQAALTLRPHAQALLAEQFTLEDFVRTLLRLSYLGEQRVAEDSKVEGLFQAEREHYLRFYRLILEDAELARDGALYVQPAPSESQKRATNTFLERSRRRGKMRWPKYIMTVDNWLDVVLDKIERHHGVRVELTPLQRRWPLLFGWPKYWELKRRGVVK